MPKFTNVLVDKLYPVIEQALNKNDNKFRDNIAKYINKNHNLIFDIGPYDRIYFGQMDIDNIFLSLGLKEEDIKSIISNCFFFDIPYNPPCIKEPYVCALFMAIRYYLINNKRKNAELTAIFLCFSGKFYASIHGEFFKMFPPSKYRSVMDYVINTMLTSKFDIKDKGSLFGAIQSMVITYLNTYEKNIIDKDMDDDDCGKLVQQLRDRERSFMKNISKLYYEAYENKYYLNYETDNVDEEHFRLTTNDATMASRVTESTINYLTSNYVSLDICNKCKDSNVKANEIKDIIESILGDNKNLTDIRRVINIIICDFMREHTHGSLSSVEFISYSIAAKPNSKDPYINELKTTILKWLDENSPNYRKRKSRKATAISYYRSILTYFVLIISKVAQKIK